MKIDKKDAVVWMVILLIVFIVSIRFFQYINTLETLDPTEYQLLVMNRTAVKELVRMGYALGYFTGMNLFASIIIFSRAFRRVKK